MNGEEPHLLVEAALRLGYPFPVLAEALFGLRHFPIAFLGCSRWPLPTTAPTINGGNRFKFGWVTPVTALFALWLRSSAPRISNRGNTKKGVARLRNAWSDSGGFYAGRYELTAVKIAGTLGRKP